MHPAFIDIVKKMDSLQLQFHLAIICALLKQTSKPSSCDALSYHQSTSPRTTRKGS
jgi:hypothetical protein